MHRNPVALKTIQLRSRDETCLHWKPQPSEPENPRKKRKRLQINIEQLSNKLPKHRKKTFYIEIVFITQVDVGSWCVIIDKSSALLIMKRVIFLALHCLQRKGKHWCILVISRVCSLSWLYHTCLYSHLPQIMMYSAICILCSGSIMPCVRPFAWDHDAVSNKYSIFFILYSGYIAPLYAAICNCSNPIPYWEARWMEGCISGRYI